MKISPFTAALLLAPVFGTFYIGNAVYGEEAGPSAAEPNPAPTASVDINRNRVEFSAQALWNKSAEGDKEADSERAKNEAYEIAELEALYKVARSVPTDQSPKDSLSWDLQAGNCQYLNWLSRSRFFREQPQEGKVSVNVSNDSWLSYKSNIERANPRLLYRGDFDGDKVAECIYLDQNSGLEIKRGQRLIGALYPLSSFQAMSTAPDVYERLQLPSPNFISYTSVNSIKNVELNGDKLSLEIVLDCRESIYGLRANRQLVSKNFTIQIAKDDRCPFINIVEPLGNRVASSKNVPLRGVIDAPAGILRADLTLNGDKLWSSPLGLESKNLEIDLYVDLKQGSNDLKIETSDLEGRKLQKNVTIYAAPPSQGAKTRVLIIGPDYSTVSVQNSNKAMQVRKAFLERGFSVKTLSGTEATRDNVQKALDSIASSATPSDLVAVYFIGNCLTGRNQFSFLCSDSATAYSKGIDQQCLSNFHKSLPGSRLLLIGDIDRTVRDGSFDAIACELPKFPRQLDNRYFTALISGMEATPSSSASTQDSLTDVFLYNLENTQGDLFRVVKLAYPVLCSNATRNKGSLPTLITF